MKRDPEQKSGLAARLLFLTLYQPPHCADKLYPCKISKNALQSHSIWEQCWIFAIIANHMQFLFLIGKSHCNTSHEIICFGEPVVTDKKKKSEPTTNSTTPVHGLRLVLQLRCIKVNGAKLQYQTQPQEKWRCFRGENFFFCF